MAVRLQFPPDPRANFTRAMFNMPSPSTHDQAAWSPSQSQGRAATIPLGSPEGPICRPTGVLQSTFIFSSKRPQDYNYNPRWHGPGKSKPPEKSFDERERSIYDAKTEATCLVDDSAWILHDLVP